MRAPLHLVPHLTPPFPNHSNGPQKIYPPPPHAGRYCGDNMKSAAIPVPMHRVQRFETWARLWLSWFAGRLIAWYGLFAPIPRAAERQLHEGLDVVARLVCCTVLLRALARMPARAARHCRPPANATQRGSLHGGFLRAAFGAALRRPLKRGSVSQRLLALTDALAKVDALAVKLLRRLACGLSRRRPIRARREAILALRSAVAPRTPSADTS